MTDLGLYVHIPFCSIKCYYCDFTAFAGQGRQVARYLEALKAEARLTAPRTPTTLYIGGGTPSELSAPEISGLLSLVRGAYPGAAFTESTFEANPESLSAEKLRVLADGGVDRLSLGLQTADDQLLKSIGRRHAWDDFLRIYRQARGTKAFALSVDLMYGLPDQDLASFLSSLDSVLELEPEHLSVYGLHVEDRTLFAKRCVEPEEGLGREMFEACLERLAAAGYNHYEISNFSRPGHESRHNMNYWENGDYIGLGCGAATYLDGERSTNIDVLIPYMDKVFSGVSASAGAERLTGKEKLGENVLLGLRLLRGMELGLQETSAFAHELRSLSRRGLIERVGPLARLTREGVFLYNQAAAEFVAPFDTVEVSA